MSFESYRTRSAILNAAARRNQAGHSVAPFSLAFLSDHARMAQPELIARVMPSGSAFILRDYNRPGRKAMARRLLQICKRRGVYFLVGGAPELAEEIGADGVHYPSWQKLTARPRNAAIITAACHNGAELDAAYRAGADLALLSPVFATDSHPGDKAMSAARFRSLSTHAKLPVLALGGVDETNFRMIVNDNVAGFAAIGAFLPKRSR